MEMCINENFGTICDDGWDAPDAKVVCRQLGFDADSKLKGYLTVVQNKFSSLQEQNQ